MAKAPSSAKNMEFEAHGTVVPAPLAQLLSTSYLTYMHLTVTGRAIPDVRDGMKPVHRRIAYTMFYETPPGEAHKKSARIVGNVMGLYHPHGDSSIYDAMVRMAQPWTINFPIVDGQGNFGSIDGDSPAAMRYTEARMKLGYYEALTDLKLLDPNRVDMVPTYDSSNKEPEVLPVRFPAILVNGPVGIAAGVATSIPPFNFGEVLEATIAAIRNPDITDDEIIDIIKAPDFPIPSNVHDILSIRQIMKTGRGSITMSGNYAIAEQKGREYIHVTNLPYGVISSEWLMKLVDLNNAGRIAISEVKDASKGENVDIKVFLKQQGPSASVTLNTILKATTLKSSFSFNGVVLHNTSPVTMGVPGMLRAFCDFRRETIYARTEYEVNGYRDSMKRQVAMWIARYDIDNTISIIRSSHDEKEAIERLSQVAFPLAEHPELKDVLQRVDPDRTLPDVWMTGTESAKIIVENKLKTITATELALVLETIETLREKIDRCERILGSDDEISEVIVTELTQLQRFATPRKTVIHPAPFGQISTEDLIVQKDVLVTMTERGFVKIVDVLEFDEQRRGGAGKKGMPQREDDQVIKTWSCSNKDTLLVFTKNGHAFAIKAYAIDEGKPTSLGRHITNFLPEIEKGDSVCSILVKPTDNTQSIVFVTSSGSIRRNSAELFESFTVKGKRAMKLPPQTEIVSVLSVNNDDDIMLYSSDGKAIRTQVSDENLRTMNSRDSVGVGGMSLADGEKVLGAIVLPHSDFPREKIDAYVSGSMNKAEAAEMDETSVDILTVTSNGYGKRFSSHSIQPQRRGGQGSLIGKSRAPVILCRVVAPEDSLSLTTDKGVVIRIKAKDTAKYRDRAARGVTLLKLNDGSAVVDCSVIPASVQDVEGDTE